MKPTLNSMIYNKNYLLDQKESLRLRFRLVTQDDFDTWLPFYHDRESTRYWGGLPADPVQACKEQFNRIFERYEKGLGGMNALIHKENGSMIGLCGLLVQEVDKRQELEIGYSLLPVYRSQGYATEAAGFCTNHAFANEWASSLISIIHKDNLPSQQVAIKNGMSLEKATIYKDNPVYIYRINNVG